MIQGISDILRKHNFQLMISDCGNSMEIEETLIRAYVAQRVCGLILHNTKHSEGTLRVLANAGIPCVETGDLKKTPIDSAVSYSNYAAGQAMARHFVAVGYKSMAFVSLPVENRDRINATRRGFVAALRKENVEISAAQLIEVDTGLENGAKALNQILEKAPQTEAIFFSGDVLAAGALFECQRRGIKVPKRIALANSDDTELFAHSTPKLTSIHYPRYEIGVQAAQIIVERTRNPDSPPVLHDVGFTVVRREST
jgi:LacI family gluconate utilization system Gnt-I transcriptional repressor